MSNPAFSALLKLAEQTKTSEGGALEATSSAPRWSGIGFSLMGFKFVVPMGQISELMHVPAATVLPGVHAWVAGLANVRGRLLPLFDLAGFLGGALTLQKKQHRVLVLETDLLYSGLIIDQSHGMQHFEDADERVNVPDSLPETFRDLVDGAYVDDSGNSWVVFDFYRLAEDARFGNAALVHSVGA